MTLLGFFFILGNVVLLEIYIPDLVGPVSRDYKGDARSVETHNRAGAVMGVLQLCVWHVDVRRRLNATQSESR